MGYCERSDVFRWFPRGGVSNPARFVSAVSAASETLTVDGHGLQLNDEVTFRAESGGTLPSPLVAGTTYYAIPVTDSTFQVSATSGGAAVNTVSNGSGAAPLSWNPQPAASGSSRAPSSERRRSAPVGSRARLRAGIRPPR